MTRTRYEWLLTAFLALAAALWLIPVGLIIFTAIRSQGDLIDRGFISFPAVFAWSNFSNSWELGGMATYFRNSVTIVLIKVPLGLFFSSMAAYSLAKAPSGWNGKLLLYFLIGLGVPAQVTLLPLVRMLHRMGIANSLWGLAPPYTAFGIPLQVFVFRAFFRTIPHELIEAARLDGASEWSIYSRIAMPIARPALITLFVIDLVGTWNEMLIALVVLSSQRVRTVPLGLLTFQGQFGTRYTQLTAAILISVLPVIIVYLLCQRFIVSGITAGSIKE